MRPSIVVLLTDFGERDGYAGILKGVLFSLAPSLRIVDLSHGIEPYNTLSAAYLLYSAWEYFPPGTVFCAVVDPGVGSDRGTCLALCEGRYLIAPDNGLASLLCRMKPDLAAWELNPASVPGLGKASAQRAPSGTFHGRDIFAPAAALCAQDRAELLKGRPIEPVVLPEVYPLYPRGGPRGALCGRVMHIDRFGNCITSIHERDLTGSALSRTQLRLRLRCAELEGLKRTYSDVRPGEPLFLLGSCGFLEVAVREASAARQLGIGQREEVTLNLPQEPSQH